MNAASPETLWRHLSEAGVVSGEAPPVSRQHAPWYVRAMLGAAGWIGALFLLGFVGVALAYVFRNAAAAITLGALCCVTAYAIFRLARHNDFLAQFGLALAFAGQALVFYGLAEGYRGNATGLALLISLIEASLALALHNSIHRVWSTLAASLALSFALSRMGLFGLAPALVSSGMVAIWLHEALWAQRGSIWRPVGYGLALSLACVESLPIFERSAGGAAGSVAATVLPHWSGALLSGVVGVYAVRELLVRNNVAATSRTGLLALVATVVIAVVTRDAPGVAAALLVLTLGHAVGSRMLLGLGVAGLLGWLSYYYYSLQMTLLAKSGVLAVTGVALLVMWLVIRRLWPQASSKVDRA